MKFNALYDEFDRIIKKIEDNGLYSIAIALSSLKESFVKILKVDSQELSSEAIELLAFLNEKTGKKFPPVETNLKLVRARIKEFGAVKVRQVIAYKCREWGNDNKFSKFLRPKTIFGATNFANYVGDIDD